MTDKHHRKKPGVLQLEKAQGKLNKTLVQPKQAKKKKIKKLINPYETAQPMKSNNNACKICIFPLTFLLLGETSFKSL